MKRRAKPKRQRGPARAKRKPKVCATCGVRNGDPHDKDEHYNAMLRRMGVSVEGDVK